MKHIEQCEVNTNESLNTNMLGTKYILDSIEDDINSLSNLETVLFVSSDKACSPINNYGMCKAISETLMIEKSNYINTIKEYSNSFEKYSKFVPFITLMMLSKESL